MKQEPEELELKTEVELDREGEASVQEVMQTVTMVGPNSCSVIPCMLQSRLHDYSN